MVDNFSVSFRTHFIESFSNSIVFPHEQSMNGGQTKLKFSKEKSNFNNRSS